MILADVRGVKKIVRNLKKQGRLAAHRCEVGLKRAGLFLQRESLFICPIEWGNLRGSSFCRAKGKGYRVVVQVGYTADYAVYVHERLDLHHDAPTQAKFLEQPARTKRAEMFKIIKFAGQDKGLKL